MASVRPREWTSPDGKKNRKWEVRYKAPDGSYPGKMFATKKLADAYRLKVETELAGGDHIVPSQSRTIAAATILFLEEVDNKVAIGAMRPCTARNYHAAFRRSFLPTLGSRLMLDLDPADIERWYHDTVRAKRMLAATAARRLWFLKALFDYAARRRWIRKGHNPAAEAMEVIGRPREGRVETFDLEGVRRVIAAAQERPFNGRARPHETLRLAVNLAAFCGLRWGEIFGLTINDVDLEGKAIHIRHSLDGLQNLQPPKTDAGRRSVPLPDHIATLLAEFLAAYPTEHPEGIIFTSEGGTPARASNFWKVSWLPLQLRAGVAAAKGNPMRFHALRHFAVSWMIENNWPITDVSAIVGHANVSITLQVYAHVVKGRRQSAEAMQSLASRLLDTPMTITQIALPNHTPDTHGIENAVFAEA